MTARLAGELATDAWLVRGADLDVGYEQPAPVPAEADATHRRIRLFIEAVKTRNFEQNKEPGLETVTGIHPGERQFRIVAEGVPDTPTIDDRIIFLDGKNFQILRVRPDGHVGNTRLAWVATVRPLEETLAS